MAEVESTPPPAERSGRRPVVIAALVGIVGLVLAGIAIAVSPERALLGYLFAFVTVAAIAIGGLVILLAGYTANARWFAPLRRLQEALAIVFPLLAILFIPIALGIEHIYVWADPTAQLSAFEEDLLDAKRAWLSPAGFVIRSYVYLAIFIVAAEVLRWWSRRRDRELPAGDPEALLRRDRMFAAAMLPPVGLALTFASFDWLMSLQHTWFSTMFGVYFFAAGFVAAWAMLAIIAWRLREGGLAATITPHHFHALGRMVFAFVVFWGYAAYFQGFLIQIADRPIEVTFYLARLRGGWDVVLWLILALRFVLPFFLLLPRGPKLWPRYVASVAGIVLAGHVLDMFWHVVPAREAGVSLHWADIAALAGIAGSCIAFAMWRQRGVPLVPTGDPFVPAGTRYESTI